MTPPQSSADQPITPTITLTVTAEQQILVAEAAELSATSVAAYAHAAALTRAGSELYNSARPSPAPHHGAGPFTCLPEAAGLALQAARACPQQRAQSR
jgi:hypothetical protein